MSFMTHFLFLVSYAVAAAAAGFMLPRSLPHLDPMLCYLLAGAGFLAAAVLHEMISRRLAQRDGAEQLDQVYDEIDELREVNRGLIAEITRAREEMAVLCEVVETAADGSNQALVREMKVLQSQLGQFGDVKPPKPANVERRRAGASRSAKAAPAPEAQSDAVPAGARESAPAPRTCATAAVTTRTVETRIAEEEILGHIREALGSNRIDLYLQPIVSLPQRRTRHYEAFSRIRTADGRIVTPAQYIEVAKEQA